MVLVDFTREELELMGAIIDCDCHSELRKKINTYVNQKNFVYFGGQMLDEKGTERFLEYEATQEELDYAKEADELYRNTTVVNDDYCYGCKQEKTDQFRTVCSSCFPKDVDKSANSKATKNTENDQYPN